MVSPGLEGGAGAVTGRADCVWSNGLGQGLISIACLIPLLSLSSGLAVFKGYKDGLPEPSF